MNFKNDIAPGDYFEDCSFGPALCIAVEEYKPNPESSYLDYTIKGISLISGDFVTCCIPGCGPRKLTFEQAIKIRLCGPDRAYVAAIKSPDPDTWESKWWDGEDMADYAADVIDLNPALNCKLPSEKKT